MGLQFKGAKQRMDTLYELGLFIAWHTALFHRVPRTKKLPDLGPLLKKILATAAPATKGQTWQEMKAAMKGISAIAADVPVVLPKKREPVPVAPVRRKKGR